MCRRCIEKYQGMPISQAKMEIVLAQATLASLIEAVPSVKTPDELFQNVGEEMPRTAARLKDLVELVKCAEAAGRDTLSPATDGLIVRQHPLALMLGLPIPPLMVTKTWADGVGSKIDGEINEDKFPEEKRPPRFLGRGEDEEQDEPLL